MEHHQEYRIHLFNAILCTTFAIATIIVGGVISSPVVINEGGHLISDCIGFILVVLGFKTSAIGSTEKFTFGFGKLESLMTLLSVVILWDVTIIVFYLSGKQIADKFTDPSPWAILGIGLASFVVNTAMFIMTSGAKHGHSHGSATPLFSTEIDSMILEVNIIMYNNEERMVISGIEGDVISVDIQRPNNQVEVLTFLESNGLWISNQVPSEPHEFHAEIVQANRRIPFNIREPRLSLSLRNSIAHLSGHLFQSSSIILVGILLLTLSTPYTYLIDPIVAIFSGLISLGLTFSVTRTSIRILLDSAPGSVNVTHLMNKLSNLQGIDEIHDLHVWRLKSGKHAMTAHILTGIHETDELLVKLNKIIQPLGIGHTTFQFERVLNPSHHANASCGLRVVPVHVTEMMTT